MSTFMAKPETITRSWYILDAAGKPTRDYTKVVTESGKAGVDYSMLAVRFEIDF